MKIAVLAPFEESVPPKTYGGTELVVSHVVEELVRMGHDVTLVASGDSETSAKLVPVFERSIRATAEAQDMKVRDALKYMGLGKVMTYLARNSFDIVHNHIGWRVLPFEKMLDCPVVTTLHGPLDVPYQQRVYGAYKDSNYVSISLNQRRPMPELNFVANVYNGIDVGSFDFHAEPQDYFAFLGRMSPEKGPVQAIRIAKRAGVKLVMAAKVDAVDRAFFEKEVEPLIDGEQIRFIGEVGHEEKNALLGGAKALLAPIQWEEPFGLFFVEAMVCGTPVVAMSRGSVPEIVVDGKTGFACGDEEEAVEAIGRVGSLDRKTCREHASARFSKEKMAQGYVGAYEAVLAKRPELSFLSRLFHRTHLAEETV
jgi:glycosyltransferase involved in cell wall biosynthesis